MNSNSNNFREMFWDESNRLRVVNDNDHQIQHYIYDGAGERILKASSQIETVYENGQVDANTTTMGLYTTYVSPYMVVDANQKYSKHYFNGTQRVASKIGEQDIAIFENGNQYLKQTNSKAAENTPSTDFDALKNKQITDFSYYLSKNGTTTKNVKVNYTEYKKADANTETTSAKAADNNSTYAAQEYAEIYYYHSDHLGTGTFLSDFEGNPYQFFLNLPFGETMAEQHSYSGEYTNRYKFNGKELDEETGFYYYGARYYNPKFSIWLSVDPLAEEFPNWNPYNYCMENPINLIDPTGMSPDGWGRKGDQWEYDEKITKDNYKTLGYSDYSDGKTNNTYNTHNDRTVTLLPKNHWKVSRYDGKAVESKKSEKEVRNDVVEPSVSKLAEVEGNTLAVIDMACDTPVANFVRGGAPRLASLSKGLKVGGNLLGGFGIIVSTYQYNNGQISGLEFTVDALISGAAIATSIFAAPAVATVFAVGALAYFGGKAIYEYSSGKTLYEKPIQIPEQIPESK
jgi:RHS repeat-associated protein